MSQCPDIFDHDEMAHCLERGSPHDVLVASAVAREWNSHLC